MEPWSTDSCSTDDELFPTWRMDDIWEQWNQRNELRGDSNLPVGTKQKNNGDVAVTRVFDAGFKWLYEVPSHLISHTPSSRLNITRLVACRNYKPCDPNSCPMGNGCKFVHADVDYSTLKAHPIHVNYVWRREDLCTYDRLPPNELLEVLSGDMSTIQHIRSERILVTRGALARHDIAEPLIRCRYFDTNQTCFNGEQCNYIHVICVDPNIQGTFKRAPKATSSSATSAGPLPLCSGDTDAKGKATQDAGASGYLKGEWNAGVKEQVTGGQHMRGSGWVPNASSPSFEPNPTAQLALQQGLNGMGGFPQNGLQQHLSGPQGAAPVEAAAAVSHALGAGNMQETLASLRGTGYGGVGYAAATGAGTGAGVGTQEQVNTLVSQLVSIIAQQSSAPRAITVPPSQHLDNPSAIGTLLYLPNGASEAVAVQPVLDSSFLNLVVTLGAGQRRPVSVAQQLLGADMGGGDVWQMYGAQAQGTLPTAPSSWSYPKQYHTA